MRELRMIRAVPFITVIVLFSTLAGCCTPASNPSKDGNSTSPVKLSGDVGVRYQSMSTNGINPEHLPAELSELVKVFTN